MKITTTATMASFIVSATDADGNCRISFYENGTATMIGDETEGYEYDEYVLKRRWYPMLEADIEANYQAWLSQAKAEEEARTPVDAHQLRADIDYIFAMAGLS